MTSDDEWVKQLRNLPQTPIDGVLAARVRRDATLALAAAAPAPAFGLPLWANRALDVALVLACVGQMWWSTSMARAAILCLASWD